jgi:hypothetical protein
VALCGFESHRPLHSKTEQLDFPHEPISPASQLLLSAAVDFTWLLRVKRPSKAQCVPDNIGPPTLGLHSRNHLEIEGLLCAFAFV